VCILVTSRSVCSENSRTDLSHSSDEAVFNGDAECMPSPAAFRLPPAAA
jgi:hypothetical protein